MHQLKSPNALEAERELLAACFKQGGTDFTREEIVSTALAELSPDHFAHPHYQKIFVGMHEAVKDAGTSHVEWSDVRQMIDQTSEARGTLRDIVTQADLPPIGRRWVTRHIQKLDEMHKSRMILDVTATVQTKAKAGLATDAYDELTEAIFALGRDRFHTGAQPWDYYIDDIKEEVTKRRMSEGVVGLETGMQPFDYVFGGLQKKHLYYVGGRPGHKKSVVVFQAGYNVADKGFKVLVASPEMTTEKYTTRLACSLVGLDYDRYNRGDYTKAWEERIHETLELFRHKNVIFNESGQQSTTSIRQDLIRFNPDLLVVDYSQLFEPSRPKYSDYQDLTLFSKELNTLKKDFKIPILAAVQLSRKVEERDDKRPRKDDIRATGQFEQDADGIFMLYNEREYAKQDALGMWWMDVGEDDPIQIDPTRLEFVCAKNRNGSRQDIEMYAKEGELWLRNEKDFA